MRIYTQKGGLILKPETIKEATQIEELLGSLYDSGCLYPDDGGLRIPAGVVTFGEKMGQMLNPLFQRRPY